MFHSFCHFQTIEMDGEDSFDPWEYIEVSEVGKRRSLHGVITERQFRLRMIKPLPSDPLLRLVYMTLILEAAFNRILAEAGDSARAQIVAANDNFHSNVIPSSFKPANQLRFDDAID